jgi:hypothetical protein
MRTYATTAAFVLCFLVTGIPYWSIPYNKVNLPSAVLEPWLVVVPAAAALLVALGWSRFWRGVMLLTGVVPAVVMARVIVDGVADKSSHNLWPFELVIAFAVGFPCALAGGAAGAAVRRLLAGGAEEG